MPVVIGDFQQLNGRLVLKNLPQALVPWNQHIRHHPARLYTELGVNLPDGLYTFTVNAGGDGNFEFELKDPQRVQIAQGLRLFDLPNHIAENGYFSIAHRFQGQAIAKHVLCNQFRVFRSWGIRTVKVHAALNVGGYAWARFGFLPLINEWQRLQIPLHQKALRLFSGVLSTQQLANVVGIITNNRNDPRTLWDIADLTLPFRGTTVGKELLMGTSWDGEFHFNNQACVDRFRLYTGCQI